MKARMVNELMNDSKNAMEQIVVELDFSKKNERTKKTKTLISAYFRSPDSPRYCLQP